VSSPRDTVIEKAPERKQTNAADNDTKHDNSEPDHHHLQTAAIPLATPAKIAASAVTTDHPLQTTMAMPLSTPADKHMFRLLR
jgi:hypothetical protein